MRSSLQPVVKTLASRNTVSVNACRHFLWFGKKDNVRFPKDLDHATGEERLVRLAIEKGIKDPFDVQEQVRGPGTKGILKAQTSLVSMDFYFLFVCFYSENPNVVQTFQGSRLIGCKCEEESTTIKYMWIHLNEPKRCECGFYFKAVPARKFWEEVGK